MALVPFFEVSTDAGESITDYITSFSFTDSIKGNSVLSLTFVNKDVDFFEDNEWLRIGQKLNFFFGYGNNKSQKRVATLTEVNPVYGDTVTISVEADDKGVFLKKNNAQTVYKKQKASDIAKVIAQKYGMDTDIEESEIIYDAYPQGNRSDNETLRDLAKKNDFSFYIRDNTLIFKKNLLKTASVMTLAYKDPNGIVKRFAPKISYVTQDIAVNSVTVKGVDTKTNQPFSETVTTKNITEDVKAGNAEVQYSSKGERVGETSPPTSPPATSSKQEDLDGKIINVGSSDKEEAVKQAQKEVRKAQLASIEASLDLSILEPSLMAGDIITIKGVGKTFEGNYLIEEIRHFPYTSMTLKRNATNKSVAKTESKVAPSTEKNTSVGASQSEADTTEKAPEVVKYNPKGQRQ